MKPMALLFSAVTMFGAETNFIELTAVHPSAVSNNKEPVITASMDQYGIPIVIDSAPRRALKEYFEKLSTLPFAVETDAGFYDLTDAWKAMNANLRAGVPIPEKLREFVVFAKVFQVGTNGLIIKPLGSNERYFVKNYPLSNRTVDGSEAVCVCVPCGRFQYVSTQGAMLTIPKLDCGKRIMEKNTPEEILRVTAMGVFHLKRP